jgi:hypothetical protein
MTIAPVGAAPPAPAASVAPRARFGTALEARAALRTSTAPAAAPRPGAATAALANVERAQARLDAVLAAARSGKTFTAGELLTLQAEAYRCAQIVDLGAKLAEQGAQAVRQALGTQL